MQALSEFRIYLSRQDKRQSTIDWYIELIEKLLTECPSFSLNELNNYLIKLKDSKKKSHYLNHYVYAIRHWGKCFNIIELQNMPRFKEKERGDFERAIFSDEEVDKFLNYPNPHKEDSVYAKRYDMWIIFYTIMAWSGMRPSEVASLRCDGIDNYVDLGSDVFRLKYTKTKSRNVPIYKGIKLLIENYIKELNQPYLFPVYTNRKSRLPHVGASAWIDFFRQHLKRLNIKRENLDPYSFRHTWIDRNVEKDLKKTQEVVGHKRLETTAIYIHNNLKKLQKFVNDDPLQLLKLDGEGVLDEKEKDIQQDYEKYKDLVWITVKERNSEVLVVEYRIKKQT